MKCNYPGIYVVMLSYLMFKLKKSDTHVSANIREPTSNLSQNNEIHIVYSHNWFNWIFLTQYCLHNLILKNKTGKYSWFAKLELPSKLYIK